MKQLFADLGLETTSQLGKLVGKAANVIRGKGATKQPISELAAIPALPQLEKLPKPSRNAVIAAMFQRLVTSLRHDEVVAVLAADRDYDEKGCPHETGVMDHQISELTKIFSSAEAVLENVCFPLPILFSVIR